MSHPVDAGQVKGEEWRKGAVKRLKTDREFRIDYDLGTFHWTSSLAVRCLEGGRARFYWNTPEAGLIFPIWPRGEVFAEAKLSDDAVRVILAIALDVKPDAGDGQLAVIKGNLDKVHVTQFVEVSKS
jgi:hypothetical protein